jgi:hypothetical protein
MARVGERAASAEGEGGAGGITGSETVRGERVSGPPSGEPSRDGAASGAGGDPSPETALLSTVLGGPTRSAGRWAPLVTAPTFGLSAGGRVRLDSR